MEIEMSKGKQIVATCGLMMVFLIITSLAAFGIVDLLRRPERNRFISESMEIIDLLKKEVFRLETEVKTLKVSLRWETVLKGGVLSELEVLELDAIELKLRSMIENETWKEKNTYD